MPRLISVYVVEKRVKKLPIKTSSSTKSQAPKLSHHSRINFIQKPRENDIISGRGTHVYNHQGNINFMSLVKKYQSKYEVCPKSLKKVHSKEIYTSIRKLNPPGRFLKPCIVDGIAGWAEMDYKNTILKVRQAMRDNELREMRIRQTLKNYALHCEKKESLLNKSKPLLLNERS